MLKLIATWLTGILTLAWTLFSLFAIFGAANVVFTSPDTTVNMMSVTNNQATHAGFGLSYHGTAGAALLVAQLLIVAAAIPLALMRPLITRRIALAILTVWTLLWLGNTLWMEYLSGGDHPAAAIPAVILTAVVIAFAGLRWGRKGTHQSPRRPGSDAEGAERS